MLSVIGGSGFVGSKLCELLVSKGHSFKIYDKNISALYPDFATQLDVRSEIELEKCIPEDCSVIVNLAAEHRDDVSPKSLYYETNVLGAINICNVARKKNIQKIVFTSSVAVYGFAPLGTNENGAIAPFNEYGKTKYMAELAYIEWYKEDPFNRALVIVRPTVIFGEKNRGNVFNLLKQLASGKFIMVGDGLNRKSIAYVENIASFLVYSVSFNSGLHIYNYIDKPDFSMNDLVGHVNKLLGKSVKIKIRLPFIVGLSIGILFDFFARILNKKFDISSIRVRKFCANSVYESQLDKTGFIPPVSLLHGLEKTIRYEFIDNHKNDQVFYTE